MMAIQFDDQKANSRIESVHSDFVDRIQNRLECKTEINFHLQY